MFNAKCLVTIMDLKKTNQLNKTNNQPTNVISNKSIDKLVLDVYIKTISIKANINGTNESNGYFIDPNDNKLYKYNTNGTNPRLANGNFLIAICNQSSYINHAFKVSDGNMQEVCTFFDGTNLKLIVKGDEICTEGTLILTDDYKIFVRIGNGWFSK